MKTNFRNLGTAILLSIATIGVNATELRITTEVELEPALEIENWMMDRATFELNKDDLASGTVVDMAIANADFSILVEAVVKADLAGALGAEGPFTVFAPTNNAFNALFKELGVSGIQDLSAEQLTPILTYHVVSGTVMSSDLSNTSVATLNGKKIKIDLSEGVKINESNVVTADLLGSNGVIHVIDRVLIPAEAKSPGCSN
jgi:transforming growth factor-beta-induced protein